MATDYWIIDWMTGMAGNPSGDIARSLLFLTYGTMPEGTPKIVSIIVNFLRQRISESEKDI